MSQVKFGAILAFTIIVGFMLLAFQGMKDMAAMNRIRTACYWYNVNGAPSEIIINGVSYKVQEDGKINNVDIGNMPVSHRQRISYEQCIKVNIAGMDHIEREE